MVNPTVEFAEYLGLNINPFSVPPVLTYLKNRDNLIAQDNDGYWHLTKLGQKAYRLMGLALENWDTIEGKSKA
ncbi:MAG: hypothetical protein CVT48_00935 [Thermoplasmata archaeon HGW-Thermoplasmata-1]|nr:MAG: hypothetical protein CVT48_00935 [Thermoplasmata archaeon HGW-Thermoplasmata-1]